MNPPRIRPIAIGIFRNGERIFVIEWYDTVKKEQFYRPPGGGIDFGERGEACLRREIHEEIGAEVKELHYLGMIENIFTFEGKPGHEIVLVYEGRFADNKMYEIESVRGNEEGADFIIRWKELADFRSGKAILYPEGLLQLLEKTG